MFCAVIDLGDKGDGLAVLQPCALLGTFYDRHRLLIMFKTLVFSNNAALEAIKQFL